MINWLLLLVYLLPGIAVKKGDFRKCDDTGFCKRQRGVPTDTAARLSYVVDPSSLGLVSNSVVGILAAVVPEIKSDDESYSSYIENAKPLAFQLDLVFSSLLRLEIKEAEPFRKRYKVPDDILSDKARSSSTFNTFSQEDDKATVTYKKTGSSIKYRAVITYKPFKIEVFNGSATPAVIVNQGSNLYFEPFREVSDGDNQWDEKFGSHTYKNRRGPSSIGLDFYFPGSFHLFGIPEHASTFALKNTVVGLDDSYNEPYRLFNLDVFEYELDEPMALYGSSPILVAHQPKNDVGIFWTNTAETFVDIGEQREGSSFLSFSSPTLLGKSAHFISETGVIEVFISVGDTPQVVSKELAMVTGNPQLPPMFAISFHQCRWNYNSVEDVKQVNEGFEEHDIPMDVLWLDIEHTDDKKYFTWHPREFKEPEKMLDHISGFGRKMVTIVDPHIKQTDSYYIYKEMKSRNFIIKDWSGQEFKGWCWPGDSVWPDFTDPTMRLFWGQQFKLEHYKGSTNDLFTWNDMNEPSVFSGPEITMPKSNLHADGWEHRDVHNIYGYYVHVATYLGHLLRERNQRPFVLTRAFFAGSSKYGAAWTGDNTASWEHLEATTPMLLSHSIAGITFIGADVGGFFGDPDAELMFRWMQVGAFHPFFRSHAHKETKRREPWIFGDEWTQRFRTAIWMRYQILPYLYTLFQQAHDLGTPIMRPLWYEFPMDTELIAREDSFMLGPALYVHPVVKQNMQQIKVELPGVIGEDVWYRFESGWKQTTPGEHVVDAGLDDVIPVFIRGGSILLLQTRLRRSSSLMYGDPYTIVVAPDSNGNAAGEVYFDDQQSLDHLKGIWRKVKFTFKGDELSSTPDNTSSFRLPATSIIERVMVLGMATQLTQVSVVSESSQETCKVIEHSWGFELRKPDVHIMDRFTISLPKPQKGEL